MNFIDNSIDMSKIHLYKNNKSLLSDINLIKLKQNIKENIQAPVKNINVFIVRFSVNIKNDKPFKFIITRYTLTPKLILLFKDGDYTQTFTYTLDELNKYNFKEKYIGQIINILKKNTKKFKQMNVPISEVFN
jgi:hypothetical protein